MEAIPSLDPGEVSAGYNTNHGAFVSHHGLGAVDVNRDRAEFARGLHCRVVGIELAFDALFWGQAEEV